VLTLEVLMVLVLVVVVPKVLMLVLLLVLRLVLEVLVGLKGNRLGVKILSAAHLRAAFKKQWTLKLLQMAVVIL
jgi:hypothetical protein